MCYTQEQEQMFDFWEAITLGKSKRKEFEKFIAGISQCANSEGILSVFFSNGRGYESSYLMQMASWGLSKDGLLNINGENEDGVTQLALKISKIKKIERLNSLDTEFRISLGKGNKIIFYF